MTFAHWLAFSALEAHGAAPIGNAAPPPIDAQLFHPAIGGERMLWTEEVGTREDPLFQGGVLFHYTNDPLQWTGDGGKDVNVLSDVMQMDGLVEGKMGPLRLGLDLPVFLYSRGTLDSGTAGGSAVGDVAASAKLVLLDHTKAPFGLGIGGALALPTSTTELSLGSEDIEKEVTLSLDEELGRVLFAANVGTLDGPDLRLGEHLHINDFVLGRIGMSVAAGPHTGVALEATGRAAYSAPLASDATDAEWLASTYLGIGGGAQLRFGGGTGLSHGIGSPDYRLIAGFSIAPHGPLDEAIDQVAQNDAADTAVENCPLDGPPPGMDLQLRFVDQDHVTLATTTTRVDGVTDRCGHGLKAEREVVVDSDARTSPVALSQDYAVETTKVTMALELAPGVTPRILIHKDQIELREEVRFATDSAVILSSSDAMLDQVALALVQYPEIRKLRIEGHSDERGPAGYNLALSQARAAAVRDYLVGKGIAVGRLRAEGYGEMMGSGAKGEAAWAANRRVDLFVEDWQD